MARPQVVAIGGGRGLASCLRAARTYASDVTGIVSVADDGGSSGQLSAELGILPPGDIRKCLLALADADSGWAEIFEYRFKSGSLAGHSLGNLLIAAVEDLEGGLLVALERIAAMLGCSGRVLPVSLERTSLRAVSESGELVGQAAITRSGVRIHEVRLDPADVEPAPGVVEAIEAADQVILAPGSLFTSTLPPLLIEDVRKVLYDTSAQVVYVCNLLCQPGETAGLKAADHVEALLAHGARVDVMLYQAWGPDAPNGAVEPGDLSRASIAGVRVVECDVVGRGVPDLHNPYALASVLESLFPG